MPNLDPQTLDPRRAGLVSRYHTRPRTRDQSVGEHSWQNLRILLAIWPDTPRHLIVYTIFHDIGEVGTGDMPYPTKANNLALQAIMDDAEAEVHYTMSDNWQVPLPVTISPEEKQIFKIVEFIEMWEWGLNEINLGNNYARLVADRCYAAVRERLATFAEDKESDSAEMTICRDADDYIYQRLKFEGNIGVLK